jgi:hypothetical protein
MRELRRRADGPIILAALAAAMAILLAAGRGRGPAIEPGPVSASGAVGRLAPPQPELLPGEFRGPTAEEAVDVLERRQRDDESASRRPYARGEASVRWLGPEAEGRSLQEDHSAGPGAARSPGRSWGLRRLDSSHPSGSPRTIPGG